MFYAKGDIRLSWTPQPTCVYLFPSWILLCAHRSPDLRNLFPHSWHSKGLSRVAGGSSCTLTCAASRPRNRNDFGHDGHGKRRLVVGAVGLDVGWNWLERWRIKCLNESRYLAAMSVIGLGFPTNYCSVEYLTILNSSPLIPCHLRFDSGDELV